MHRSGVTGLVCLLVVVWISPLGDAAAYSLRRSKAGKTLHWKVPVVEVGVDTQVIRNVPRALEAVRAGFASWSDAGAPVQAKLVADPNSQRSNRVTWLDHDWPFAKEVVAMTVSSYQSTDGEVLETEILLNAVSRSWTTDPSGTPDAFDVENVIAHEAGHFFGLGHSDDPEATMYYATPRGELKKRSLEGDDLEGLEALIAKVASSSPRATGVLAHDEATAPGGDPEAQAGCAVAGSASSGWSLVLIALALLVGWRARRVLSHHRRVLAALVVLGLLVAPSVSEATWVRALTIEQLVRRASVVLEGKVIAVKPRRLGRWIVTEHTIAVERCLAGPCPKVAVLREVGGELDGHGTYVDGSPRLPLGKRALVLARQLRDGALQAVGMAQGVYHLRADGGAMRDLRGLDLIGKLEPAPNVIKVERLRQQIRAVDVLRLRAPLR